MSSGELHPLRISFDTARCVFPLKVSAVGAKPSEVSLYVLSAEPLLNRNVLDLRLERLHQEKIDYDAQAKEHEQLNLTAAKNRRSMALSMQMYSLALPADEGQPVRRDWTLDDLDTLGDETAQSSNFSGLDQNYLPGASGVVQIMQAQTQQLTQCARVFERLTGKGWYLTKQVCTFRPEQMQDLEFEPAIPVLAARLAHPEGRVAAVALYDCRPAAIPVLLSACQSTNATERINASSILQSIQDDRLVPSLFVLLKDPVPQVRLNAVMAIAPNWVPQFADALFALMRDPESRIRWQAAQWLALDETRDRTSKYLQLLKDPDPDVPGRALQVLAKLNPDAIPRDDLLRLLGVPRMEVVLQCLNYLQGPQFFRLPTPPIRGLETVNREAPQRKLSSLEAAPLTTNRVPMARLAGLKILYANGDTDAITLTLPLLRDTNSIVRARALSVLRAKTGQSLPADDPAKWEDWWNANKTSFKPH